VPLVVSIRYSLFSVRYSLTKKEAEPAGVCHHPPHLAMRRGRQQKNREDIVKRRTFMQTMGAATGAGLFGAFMPSGARGAAWRLTPAG
jgi:hypothetical protein